MKDLEKIIDLEKQEPTRIKKMPFFFLAFFLGTFGAHKFYQKKYFLGILYIVFSWTYLSGIAGIIEAILCLFKKVDSDGYIIPKTSILPKTKIFFFDVAGTFYENEDGKERQDLIKRFVKEEKKYLSFEKYDGLTASQIKDYPIGMEVYEVPETKEWENEIEFEFEPDNEYDENAIKVNLSYHGCIGYVPREDNILVGELIKNGQIKAITHSITGGNYKYFDGESIEKDEEEYEISVNISYKVDFSENLNNNN
ncbi:NINE protein [Fusobacterium sp. IOR10]|uniref:NINE protein n=1 Tax=Fusobacterium sp. IOR10 TaxID=2665157 RepID=UPI0013D44C70|nr:NINE protein [Fusobacterium sp. IOR10]